MRRQAYPIAVFLVFSLAVILKSSGVSGTVQLLDTAQPFPAGPEPCHVINDDFDGDRGFELAWQMMVRISLLFLIISTMN